MDFIRRAQIGIIRKPRKSILFFLATLILSTIMVGAIFVERSVETTIRNIFSGTPPIVSFTYNWHELTMYQDASGYMWGDSNYPNQEIITEEMISKIGELSYVKDIEFSIESSLNWNRLRKSDGTLGNLAHPYIISNQSNGHTGFTLQGASRVDTVQFRERVLEIVEGRNFNEIELNTWNLIMPVIMSEQLARVNNLRVGSVIEVYNRLFFPRYNQWMVFVSPEMFFKEEILQLEIVGLFDFVEAVSEDMHHQHILEMTETVLNTLHVPNLVAEYIESFGDKEIPNMLAFLSDNNINPPESWSFPPLYQPFTEDGNREYHRQVKIVLYDFRDFNHFRQAVEEIIPPFWEVDSFLTDAMGIIHGMENMQLLANLVLTATIGATLLILTLLVLLFLYDRKHEIGILLALGERKRRIVGQILLEILSLSFLAMTASILVGFLLSDAASQFMIQNELMTSQESTSRWTTLDTLGLTRIPIVAEDIVLAYQVSLDGASILIFYGITLLAVALSTIIPLSYFSRISPKKILL